MISIFIYAINIIYYYYKNFIINHQKIFVSSSFFKIIQTMSLILYYIASIFYLNYIHHYFIHVNPFNHFNPFNLNHFIFINQKNS